MDITKKDRATLKSYFLKNKIPTESNFAELIDGMLNQKDDGIAKLAGDPLSIAAAGDGSTPQKLVHFYGNLADANPAWLLQMNPRSDQNNPATAKAGFSISDGAGSSRLFIDKASGNVGIGTIAPAGAVDVANVLRIGQDEGGSGIRSLGFVRDAGDEANAGKITYKGGFGSGSLNLIGAGAGNGGRKIRLYDNVEIIGALQVNGALTPSTGSGENNGLLFPKNPGGGSGDAAWLRYYPRTGDSCTLEIGIANESSDHIALMPSGGVGIGVVEPLRKLQIGSDVAGLGVELGAASPNACALRFGDNTGWKLHFGRSRESSGGALNSSSNGALMTIVDNGNVGIGTTEPATQLHIVSKTGSDAVGYGNPMAWGQHIELAATGMWGLSDSYGALFTWESDSLFVGLKNEGGNRKDAIIAFGDDAQDSLRFLFVPSGNANAPVEHLRITSGGLLKSPMWNVTQVINNRQGGLPLTSGTFTTGGGTLVVIASGSGFSTAGGSNIGMSVQIDSATIGYVRAFTNEASSHKVFSANALVRKGIDAGSHTITLSAFSGTNTDQNDWFNVTVLELPF